MVKCWIEHAPFLVLLPLVHTWVISSRHTAQLAFHSAFDSKAARVLTTGVLFRTAFKDYTLYGASYTDCFISLGFDRALYETPQLCTHFEMFPAGIDNLPAGVSLGMDGNQASIASIYHLTEYNEDWRFMNIMQLPTNQFPVAVATDALGGVYIGMHSTGGKIPPVEPSGTDQQLSNLHRYHQHMTHPSQTTQVVSPLLVRINMVTGESDWRLEFNTTEGRSTIGGVVYLPARNVIVVAGSSSGRGNLVGAGEWSNSWDGYVTIVNATTGKVDDSAASESTPFLADYSKRIQSNIGADDYVLGICASEDDLFVLGSTNGKMTTEDATSESGGSGGSGGGGAFVRAYDVDTLNVKWTRQWSGVGVEAVKCAPTSKYVYIAGHVPAGVLVDKEKRDVASSTQDLFVSLLDTSDGKIHWTRQIDSRRHDTLANIFVAPTGELIMAHNAMDLELGVNEILTSTVSNADGFHDWQELPEYVDPLGGLVPRPTGLDASKEDRLPKAMIVSTILVSALVLLGMATAYRVVRRRKAMLQEHEGPESKESIEDSNDLELREMPEPSIDLSDEWVVNGGVVA